MTRQHTRTLALAGLIATAVLIAPSVCGGGEARTPDATIVVSSSTAASALGFILVEGTLHYRDKVYYLTVRGAQPTAGSRGNVYGLGLVRNIEGRYTPTAGALRSARGVTIVFDPPLDLSGDTLQIDLSGRRYPKASAGQRGTVD